MMSINVDRYIARFQRVQTGLSHSGNVMVLTLFLVSGLMLIAPLIGTVLSAVGIPAPIPLLIGVSLVGVGYGLIALFTGRVTLGIVISLIVTSTFAANIPLLGGANSYPGNLGPQLWFVQLPILVLIGLFLVDNRYSIRSLSRAEQAFGGFVAWSGICAIFATRVDTALYYTIFMLTVGCAFVVANRSVRYRLVSLWDVIKVFLVTMLGHATFAMFQFFHQSPFGFGVLGETGRGAWANTINLGFGRYAIGPVISGFTGGSGPISVLLVLAIPLLLGVCFAEQSRKWQYIASCVFVCLLAAVLRLTAKDGSRGALLIAFVAFAIWLWSERPWRRSTGDFLSKQSLRRTLVPFIVSLVLIFYPSSNLGKASKSGSEALISVSPVVRLADVGTAWVPLYLPVLQVTIPFFNLSSFGIRIRQYLAGILMGINNPLFGVGGGNYPYIAPKYSLPMRLSGGILFPLHNQFIAVFAETGVPGFVLFMAAIGLVVQSAWKLFRTQPRHRPMMIGVLAAIAGYLFAAFWVANIRYPNILPFWMLMGAVLATHTDFKGEVA